MPRYTLRPRRAVEPRCTDFTDETLVLRYELEMRAHRAASEGFVIEPVGPARRDGTYRVESASGSPYVVDLVGAGGDHDTCTCADFATNQLGTCKHLEAVRRGLGEVPALRRLPPVRSLRTAVLTVDARGPAPRLVAVGPGADGVAEELGLDPSGGCPTRPDRLGEVQARVVHAVAPALQRLEAAEAGLRRRRSLSRALADDRFHLDVLAEPLFPYQVRGVAHLVTSGRSLLADDMGLGKTVQAIAACEVLRLLGEAERVLVVTPASLKAQWAREVERYARRNAVVIGGEARKRRALVSAGAPYSIVNYELLWREPDLPQIVAPDVIILDEAQRAKNFRTKTATLLRTLSSRFLFVLTGTPVENRLDDLYSLMQLIDPGVFGPLWRFNLDFHVQASRNRRTGYRNFAALRARIAPFVLRRHKEDVLSQLPPLVAQTRYVALTPKQTQMERALRADAAQLLAKAQRRALSPHEQRLLMSLLLKARQACNAAELCKPEVTGDGCGKLDELEQLVGEVLEQGSAKVLVFSEWTEMLRLCSARLERAGVEHLVLHGGVPTEKRPALLERFREEPSLRVLLSTDAGGVGLNLQAASYVVHLDLPWNPGRLDQRTSRAHRLGQTRGVNVTYLCAATGIERGIEGTLAGKRAVRSAALDANSEVDAIDAPSFSVFVRELQEAMARVEAGEGGSEVSAPLDAEEQLLVLADPVAESEVARSDELDGDTRPAQLAPTDAGSTAPPPIAELGHAASGTASAGEGPPAGAGDGSAWSDRAAAASGGAPANGTSERGPSPGGSSRSRAGDRLRLADVVLAAGFGNDAVRASYEALAAAVRSLLSKPAGPEHGALIAAAYRELVPTGRAPEGMLGTLARLRDLTLLEAEHVDIGVDLASAAVRDARSWVERLERPPV